MFPLRPGDKPAPAFSLSPAERARRKNGLGRGEWRLLLLLPVLLAATVWTIYEFRDKIAAAMAGAMPAVPELRRPQPQPRPILASIPAPEALAADTLAEIRADAAARAGSGQGPGLTSSGCDAAALAWAAAVLANDRASQPISQRVGPGDLAFDGVQPGMPVLITGTLEDWAILGGEDAAWRLGLIALPERQWAVALLPADLVPPELGSPVQVLGRMIGPAELAAEPAAEPASAAGPARSRVSLIAGRALARIDPSTVDPSVDAYHQAWSWDDALYAQIDDERTWIETRPYYHALGRALREREDAGWSEGAPDSWKVADAIHQQPGDWRGKPVRVIGYVYAAWEDADVARDQPFGVARCVRLLLWRRDVGPVTETIAGVTKTRTSQVLRLYELAAVTDQPLPKPGDLISAPGRFHRFHAIPVAPDPERDRRNGVERQSDRVYPWFFITGPWTELEGPRRYELAAVGWAVLGLGVLAVLAWWWLHRRDRVQEARLHDQVRALRVQRRRTAGRNVETAETADGGRQAEEAKPGAPGEKPDG